MFLWLFLAGQARSRPAYRARMSSLAAGPAVIAGLAGVTVPLTLERMGADPAISSSVFVTMITDSMGFLAFLGLATLWMGA